jgi:hypothetical protein
MYMRFFLLGEEVVMERYRSRYRSGFKPKLWGYASGRGPASDNCSG